MITVLTLLAALISIMFVASVISVVVESRKEDEDFKVLLERRKSF
ncbi:hypothetical protein RRU01S_14_02300 [Agrobacterium rubi TR3 = NBRC 13261]|uniref:Uncharacterized protein n=1 Tax=Agrobacterium rubi TR3 = NBRC 13261 TaxID=1368415 RepID=A0A081CWG0_9HYPH|nr:hypothetical protein [Agrobacterium rubi]MBP1877968.1 hypothetical protein [Agrobacterium rubi]GAK71006.1 hypothetical protein RRU01S_14_02300 [Agrobacterium rubi TR3 = NBRC 13261]